MGSRRQAREATLQMLYLCDNSGFTTDEAWRTIENDGRTSSGSQDFAHHLFNGVLTIKSDLDKIISKHADNWEMNRMAVIDRNILRLAAFEIVDMPQTPISVIIDEAVEIAKKFSTLDSGKFVNGVLDKIKDVRKEKTPLKH